MRPCTLLVLALTVPACSTATPEKHAVTGTVSFDGQPIAEGTITFRPVDANVAPQSTQVKEGRFALDLPAGAMRVEVSASRPSQGPPVKDMGPSFEEYIPPRYHGPDTVLTADIKPGMEPLKFALEPAPQ